MYLHDRVAIVTGGSRGIGFACAMALAKRGARLAICSRDDSEIREAADRINKATCTEILPLQADMSKSEDIARFISAAEKQFGQIDVLILNGPQPIAGPFLCHDIKRWEDALKETLIYMTSFLYGILPGMKSRGFGRCILIGSSFHLEPSSEFVLSSSIRLAQIGVFKCLAKDLASAGITFNTICPGYVDTKLTQSCAAQVAAATGKTKEQVLSEWAAATPMGRFVDPEEIGKVASFLASPESNSITGQVLAVDGGASRAI